jgi:hypothetical protein
MKRSMFILLLSILICLSVPFFLTGCGYFFPQEPESQGIMTEQEYVLPDWLLPTSLQEKGFYPDEEANNLESGEDQEDSLTDSVADEIQEEVAQDSSVESKTQDQKPQDDQISSGAPPGTMEWIEEQQQQKEAARRQRERERILANLEEESSDDEDQDAWWDIQKKDEPSMSHQLVE